MRRSLRKLLGRWTGTQILPDLPEGVDLFRDVQLWLPRTPLLTVIDVGAHRGKFTRRLLERFPDARVYCFEPVSATHARLRSAFAAYPNVECLSVALAANPGSGTMLLAEKTVSCRLVPAGSHSPDVLESVAVRTLDDFCAERGIDAISLLKIDTEGGDLEVLKGAKTLLDQMAVDLVQVEAGMNPGNRLHVPFDDFRTYLLPRGYSLFRLYDQSWEAPTGEPHLRRCDPVFVSQRVIDANRGAGKRH